MFLPWFKVKSRQILGSTEGLSVPVILVSWCHLPWRNLYTPIPHTYTPACSHAGLSPFLLDLSFNISTFYLVLVAASQMCVDSDNDDGGGGGGGGVGVYMWPDLGVGADWVWADQYWLYSSTLPHCTLPCPHWPGITQTLICKLVIILQLQLNGPALPRSWSKYFNTNISRPRPLAGIW